MRPDSTNFKEAFQRLKPVQRPAPWVKDFAGQVTAALAKPYVPEPYAQVTIGAKKRPLLVPGTHDRIVQGALQSYLFPRWQAKVPAARLGSSGVEATIEALQQYVKSNPSGSFWKADIKGFYPNIKQDKALSQAQQELAQPGDDPWLWDSVQAAIHGAPSGLPTGSPLSPLIADTALLAMDREVSALAGCFMRYVDDILILGTPDQIEKARGTLEEWLTTYGLALSPHKTMEGTYPGTQLSVLGQPLFQGPSGAPIKPALPSCFYQVRGGPQVLGIPELPEDPASTLGLTSEPGAPNWSNDPNTMTTVYTWGHFVMTLLTKPSLDAVDLLLSDSPAPTNAWEEHFRLNRRLLLHPQINKALHHHAYRAHTGQVKPAYESGKNILIKPAMTVVRSLLISNRLMQEGDIPTSWGEEAKEYSDIRDSLLLGEYDVYHKAISRLFKHDYKLRCQGQNKLPASMPFEELMGNDVDPLGPPGPPEPTLIPSKFFPVVPEPSH